MSAVFASELTHVVYTEASWSLLRPSRLRFQMADPARRPKRPNPAVLVAAIGGASTILAASLSSPLWRPLLAGAEDSTPRIEQAEARISKRILYARILQFRDKRLGAPPVNPNAYVGWMDSRIRTIGTPIYDEGLYVDALYLYPHRQEHLKASLQSSGIADMDVLYPREAMLSVDREAYDRSEGHRLDYELKLRNRAQDGKSTFFEYVITSRHYYNGYQYASGRYQSDGGVTISQATDEVILIFDFTALAAVGQEGVDYDAVFKVKPHAVIRDPEGARTIAASTFEKGVLVARIAELKLRSYVLCDWEWATEDDDAG